MKEKNIAIDLYGDGIGTVELVDYMGNDLTIVNAARVSFGKHKDILDEKDEKLIKYLVHNRHTSTFEHNVATFRFTVPLFVRSQHHRHRTWSYNEISRRYTDVDIRFYEPKVFRTQHTDNRQASNIDDLGDPIINPDAVHGGQSVSYMVMHHHLNSLQLYKKLIKSGVCREQARGVLPQNMYTEYYGTCNLNNLLKFIDLRIHEGAQPEIQKVAKAVLEIIAELWPTAVDSYGDVRRRENE
jgi:thymidylate synthase (FAD)